jgi:hypothetical protein
MLTIGAMELLTLEELSKKKKEKKEKTKGEYKKA